MASLSTVTSAVPVAAVSTGGTCAAPDRSAWYIICSAQAGDSRPVAPKASRTANARGIVGMVDLLLVDAWAYPPQSRQAEGGNDAAGTKFPGVKQGVAEAGSVLVLGQPAQLRRGELLQLALRHAVEHVARGALEVLGVD